MIIVKLMGGLGNQMFQYAAARRLALRHGTEVRLDLSWFADHRKEACAREFALDQFDCSAAAASAREIPQCASASGPIQGLMRLLRGKDRSGSLRMVQEKQFHFDSALLDAPDQVYLIGYWQSERYFLDVADTIRRDFTPKLCLHGQSGEVARVIAGIPAVSVHVRRGDYADTPSTNAVHGTCSPEYYRAALELVAQRVRDPHFFVFSDDIWWCREHLPSAHRMTFVDHNGPDRTHEDFHLMSMCRHHIIANSSFSWWGAWLAPRPDKIVIAPSRWFKDCAVDTTDLIPASWLRIGL